MDQAKRIERKVFLAWALGSTSAALLGCSDAEGDTPGGGGTTSGGAGGSTTTSAGSGGSASGTAGAGGTFQSGGTAGSGGSAGTTPAGGGGASGGGGAGGSGGAAPTPNCSTQLKVFISADHGHALEVTLADVMAGATKAYDTKGKSDHSHWVVLTPADFAKLQAGMSVHKLSCNDEHEHEFIVNCLGVEKPETTSGVANFCDAEHLCGEAMGKPCADPT